MRPVTDPEATHKPFQIWPVFRSLVGACASSVPWTFTRVCICVATPIVKMPNSAIGNTLVFWGLLASPSDQPLDSFWFASPTRSNQVQYLTSWKFLLYVLFYKLWQQTYLRENDRNTQGVMTVGSHPFFAHSDRCSTLRRTGTPSSTDTDEVSVAEVCHTHSWCPHGFGCSANSCLHIVRRKLALVFIHF